MCVWALHTSGRQGPHRARVGFFGGGRGRTTPGSAALRLRGTQGVAPRLVSAEVDKSAALQQWEAFKW